MDIEKCALDIFLLNCNGIESSRKIHIFIQLDKSSTIYIVVSEG